MVAKLFIALIRLYQRSLSPDHGYFKRFYPGGYCRFQPTCSDYGIMAIEKHGAFIGSIKALYRICRCNPWNKGGLDLP
jgi:putative membrane protein insertion efficiency factor